MKPIIKTNANIGDADRDLKCQHEGGSCEFFLVCWMSNGLLHGLCGGLLRGCCHRTAKSANTGANDIIDLTDLPNKDYGPVTNDPSEFYYAPAHFFFTFILIILFLLLLLFNLHVHFSIGMWNLD